MALQARSSQPELTYYHLASHKKKRERNRDKRANNNVRHVTTFS